MISRNHILNPGIAAASSSRSNSITNRWRSSSNIAMSKKDMLLGDLEESCRQRRCDSAERGQHETRELSEIKAGQNDQNNNDNDNSNVRLIQGHHIFDKLQLDNVTLELIPLSENEYEERRTPNAADSYEIRVTTAVRRRTTTSFTIRRSIYDFIKLDHHLHNCYDESKRVSPTNRMLDSESRSRALTLLPSLESILQHQINFSEDSSVIEIEQKLREYIDLINKTKKKTTLIRCNKALKWFCLDPFGNYYNSARRAFNEPGLIQGECVHEYDAKCRNEIDMKLRDQIIVTRICRPDESIWWFGKNIGGGENSQRRSMTVGYFPFDSIKILNSTVDLEKYFIRKTGYNNTSANAKHVSSIFGKNVLLLKKRMESRPKFDELKNRSLYQDRASLQQLTHQGWEYPAIAEMCTEFVRIHCLTQGVYRKSCRVRRLAQLNEHFWGRTFPKSISELRDFCENPTDVLCVASFIKQLFRDLSEPVITAECYEIMLNLHKKYLQNMQSSANAEIFTKSLRRIIKQMHPIHRSTLLLLITHFRKLIVHVEKTNMDAENLARVWAPSLFPHVINASNDVQETIAPIKAQNALLVFIIENAPAIFDTNLDPLDMSKRSYSMINLGGGRTHQLNF